MNPIDIIIGAVIAAIVGGASYYIYRAKRSGAKCIGCPSSASCKGSCSSCGCCHGEEK